MSARELPSTFKLATLWLLILTLGFLGFKAWEHQRAQSRIEIAGGEIVLQRGPDGHFHWRGQLRGPQHSRMVDFLVDTGATSTALPEALARELALETEGFALSQTAGGTAQGRIARTDLQLQGGVSAQRLRVMVLPQLESPLLGMDVLSRLRFSQQGGELRIQAPVTTP
ncbi:TIGR02281 family clan AA aspartic protease [Pelomonas sp. CA6]|uniref:retropepsin-like aspartic protease family protein n=1 Tax=Pelomonas sp. CA6 TaxID=2907999 RepID=UPI001F4A8EAA|nr:TIGR02281 family clan AA aspartic protease [Pelomonas sp. CA6]MCH7342501.1 TIGR02281 family clan AA aspartic protease [Pelomonas sp. CA6]